MSDKKLVLVVDDSEVNVLFMTEVLEANGYRHAVARNGEEAIAALAEQVPDLVLLDLMMPRKSGIHVARHMRKNAKLKNVPFIICTGVTEATGVDVKTGVASPIDAYSDQFDRGVGARFHGRLQGIEPADLVEKPIEPDALVEKIRRVIG
jgi:CheY-like chemotaxis protein